MNYSDRWLAYKTGTKERGGNDPHEVLEYLRKNGCVLEEEWPFSDDIRTYNDYYTEPPIQLDESARKLITQYDIQHDTVRQGSYPTLQEAMWDALQYSPLGVSVGFTRSDENGYAYRLPTEPDFHWTVIVGGEYGKYWLIFDSGSQAFIRAAWGKLNPVLVKRIKVTKANNATTIAELSLWVRILTLIRNFFVEQKAAMPAHIAPTAPKQPQDESKPVEPTPQPTTAERLYSAAYAAIGKDVSPTDRADDEVACAESLTTLIGQVMKFDVILSTRTLDKVLAADHRFERTDNPIPGCVTVFPTSGSAVGHCGVWGKKWVMSNDSKTGLWQANYTVAGWYAAAKRRGLPVHHYLPR